MIHMITVLAAQGRHKYYENPEPQIDEPKSLEILEQSAHKRKKKFLPQQAISYVKDE